MNSYIMCLSLTIFMALIVSFVDSEETNAKEYMDDPEWELSIKSKDFGFDDKESVF